MSESVDRLKTSVDNLDIQTQSLEAQVVKLEHALVAQAQSARKWRLLVGAFLAAIIIVLLGTVPAMVKVSLDNRAAITENNQRWCPVVGPLAPRPGDPPPAGTPEQVQRSLRIRVAFAKLVEDFGCKPG